MIAPGSRLAHYRIIARLGRGGMGEVWRAFDERLEREVALKVLHGGADDPVAHSRLLREARLSSRLTHAHIATVHEVNEADGVAYVAMELVDGEPLDARVPTRGLPPETVLDWGFQIADALAFAHAHGVIHRDLKAANVLVSRDGRVKVVDFGIATRSPAARAAAVTAPSATSTGEGGGIAGTPGAIAPEVLRGAAADARSDLWSLGAVLHQMTAGAHPFPGATALERAAAVFSQPAPPLPGGTPSGLVGIIERCLVKDPARRYGSADEVKAALEAVASGSVPRVRRSGDRLGRGQRVAVLAVALAVLGLVVAFALDVGGLRRRVVPAPSPRAIRSLAVLPLEDFSRDPEQRWLADGMTEELITALSQIGTLRVISRTSVMGLRGTKLSTPEIARKLGVDGIVEGSVQRQGDRVKITAQLVRANNDEHLWAQAYERELSDALALQAEVARAIANEVQARLSAGEERRMSGARAVSPRAYELYLRGLQAYRRWDRRSHAAAQAFLQQALLEDSTYAPAWAAMGLVASFNSGPPQASRTEMTVARHAADRALALDPDLALAHVLKAELLFDEDWDVAGAERELRRAIALSPSLFDAHHDISHLYLATGRRAESEAESRKALALDPLNPAATLHLGWHLMVTGQYDEARAQFEATLRLDPSYSEGWFHLTQLALARGRPDEAQAAWDHFVQIEGGGDRDWLRAILDAQQGRVTQAESTLARLSAAARRDSFPSLQVAVVHAALGRKDEAFSWLNRALERHESGLTRLQDNLFLSGLRSDPRFTALLRRLHVAG